MHILLIIKNALVVMQCFSIITVLLVCGGSVQENHYTHFGSFRKKKKIEFDEMKEDN